MQGSAGGDMYLKTLHLRQFRNYREQSVEFAAPKTILLGDNAQGKSNLLESVELLSTLHSHRALRDRELVLEGEQLGQITAALERDTGPVDLAITLRPNGRRTVSLNGEALRRQLDFLGVMNAVQFSSLDLDLVRGGPGERRSWLDTLLIQLEPVYAYILQQYNTVLRQRNALLKRQRREEDTLSLRVNEDAAVYASATASDLAEDTTELAIWDAQLAAIGARVIRRRARVLDRIAPLACWSCATRPMCSLSTMIRA
jgi:DNA replication and repair protein RecF